MLFYMQTAVKIQFNTQIWKEGDMYVAYVPQLDLASCGRTIEEADKNIREATEIFFEETDRKGTMNDVLEEAGFLFDNEWKAPEILKLERVSMVI